MADLAEHELGQPDQAVSLYDAIAQRHSAGGLIDDALWHGARVAHQLGDAEGAVKRLRHLASIREVAFGTGSYLSIWHDDGQLRLGIILRDDLRRPLEAAAELRKLHELYPASILRDDARYEEAVALSMAGKPREACAALTALHDRSPDSKYELDKAPTLRRELGCRPPI